MIPQRSAGFTLTEMMIVVLLVGLLAVVAVPIYDRYVKQTKVSEARAMVGAIVAAEKAYAERNRVFVEAGTAEEFLTRLKIDVEESDLFEYEAYDVNGRDRFSVRAKVSAYGEQNGLPTQGTVVYTCQYNRAGDPRLNCQEEL
jgi:prepilin-type N-terminal cleavage/methylation domain-containing protein